MQDMKKIETAALFEMLANITDEYTRLLKVGTQEQFNQCKSDLAAVQSELESRKHAGSNLSISEEHTVSG